MFLISGTQRRGFFINENMFGNYMRVGYMVFVKSLVISVLFILITRCL